MNIKQLKYFLVVAQERQITAAAHRLYIAQPPLSYQLKQLEKELNSTLFNRTAYGIELTDAGKKFQKYAEEIVNLSQKAKDELGKEEAGEVGTIRLGLISSSGDIVPTNQFPKLTQFYPDLNFEIYENNTFGVIEDMKKDFIDMGIVRTPFNMKGLENIELNTDPMVAVFNPNFYNLGQGTLQIKDLKNLPLILYRRFEAIFNESFSHQGVTPFYAVKCDDARTAILWSDKGMGVALVPKSIACAYSKQDFSIIDHSSWITHLELIWSKEKAVTPIMKKVIDSFHSQSKK
ncbi:DNA-binding transcriptional LysR family regulator [Lactobacillus colini]|uniref:DNA-binding transcriptional LysR family regulator n=1 Tax=Lactobacillus colini TaxID=1819254 RepID=A0ABS4MCG5_9LACO|nr:LysR family transcriptional regulator [Lactobacillus colini]MBP2057031.1 DNA-binding transcriptional LysR family regulator [Lactobacillus colini]